MARSLVFRFAIVNCVELANALTTPKFFSTPAHFRRWLERHHDKRVELWVGYYKKDAGRRSITWPESVDEALCFGWIDGIRKAVDKISYTIRFTPRRKTSVWSAINIRNVQRLAETGRMQPPGLKLSKQGGRTGAKSIPTNSALRSSPKRYWRWCEKTNRHGSSFGLNLQVTAAR